MGRLRFSANLGFLWADLPLPEAIRAAADAGFDAVECHWPFDTEPEDVNAALAETELPLLGLNTWPGDRRNSEFGLAALPGREAEARDAISQAIDFARLTGTGAVHVMSGKARGAEARARFVDALRFADQMASESGIVLLIEPLNAKDVPGYHIASTGEAVDVIEEVASPNLKLMFDCYHVARSEGDVLERFVAVQDHVGHIQFAGVPKRGRPDIGDVDYQKLLPAFCERGWSRPFGAEYMPNCPTEDSLGWMQAFST